MKKMLQVILGVGLFFLLSSQMYAAGSISCDQTFENRFLRYDKTYEFYDTWHSGSKATYLNKFRVEYQEIGYFGGNNTAGWNYLDKGSDFAWTQTLKNNGFKVAANTSMEVLNTSPTKWRIEQKPNVRTTAKSNNYDFMLAYTIDYDFSNNYPDASDDKSHTECVYYSVTWCGDGVRDAGYEVCDPNDPSRTGWGNGGCSTTCEPINVNPPATCDGLTTNPTGGIAPLNVAVSCTGTNATSYQIACGNGQVINGRTGTCSYTTSSNYQARCTVNGNITSNACKKTVAVTNPTPAIRIDKVDANTADLDTVVGNDTQTVATGTKAVFKIRVTNSGNEDLKNVKVTDSIAPNCAGSVTLPGTKPSTWSNFVVAGAGNHNDAFLQPGEYFEYTCEKPNTTTPYTNRANTEGTGVTSGLKPTDTDDTQVLLVVPSIQVVKTDANSADIDGQTGNDTQTVDLGTKAVFKIRVTNDGTEDLKSIILTDSIAPNCGGSVTLPGTKPSTWSNFVVAGAGNHNDAFLQPGEYFEYTCEKPNTLTNYTNEIFVTAKGRDSNKTVNDDDPTLVKVKDTVVPACISLNVAPLTGSKPLTSNVVCTGEKVQTFKIDCGNGQVFNKNGGNNGQESFSGVCTYTTVGTFTPKCFINDTITSNACQKTVTVTENQVYDLALRKTVSSTTPGPFNIGGTVTFNIEVFNQGTINANNIEITDYIPTGLTLADTNWTQTGSLAIRTISSIAAGQSVNLPISFTINSAATGVITNLAEITRDDGDDCDSTPDQNPTNDGTPVNDDIGNGCNPGGDEDDHDPEPIVIGGTVGPAVSIDKVDANTADQDGNVGNDTQTVNVGDKAVFKIRVTNTGTEALKNIVLTDAIAPNCGGSVALPGTYPTTFLSFTTAGNGDHTNGLLDIGEYFEYTCEKPSTASAYTNSATVNATGNTSGTAVTDTDTSVVMTPGTSSTSSSSSGTPNQCYSIEKIGTTIKCIGDSQTRNFKLDCGNGREIISGAANDMSNTTRVSWDFNEADCGYDTTPRTTVAQCYVATRVSGSPAWRTRFQCQLTDTPYCGDGIIQTDRGEQCEKTINQVCSNGSTPVKNATGDYICSNGVKATPVIGSFPSICSTSCKFTGGSSSSSSSSGDGCTNPNGCGVITIPNQGNIVFGPQGNMVIGHGKNPLIENGVMPFIRNDSDYDLYFDEVCVTKTGNALDGTQTQCKTLGDILYPGEIVKFDAYPSYSGNKNNIPAGQSYVNNQLTTTIRTEGELYDWAFFAAKLGVRVSKPAVATTGGGTSLVKDTTKMADISEVANGIENTANNKNFVGVGVTGGSTSSFSDTVTDSGAVNTISAQGDTYNQSIDKISKTDVLTEALTGVSGFGEFATYNGLENVYILKGKNLTLTSIPAALKGARTYIIEGGNLTIAGDLNYSDNIAFVVRGGNIIVDDSVTKMSGTYISIPVSGNGGAIQAQPSDKQLVVSGSLYGNISNLVDNRYYVDNNSTTGVINVGTIVKFGSSLFKKPAPLVGQFISEYLATEKVSQ